MWKKLSTVAKPPESDMEYFQRGLMRGLRKSGGFKPGELIVFGSSGKAKTVHYDIEAGA